MRSNPRLRSLTTSLIAAAALGAPLLVQTAPVASASAVTTPPVVHAESSVPVLADAAAAIVATTSSTLAARTAYRLTGRQPDGSAIRWNPCAPIPWVFNPRNAPANALPTVSAALQRVAQATGLRFRYAGTSTQVPATSYLARQSVTAPRPMLIGWTTGTQSSLLANQPSNVAGMTQPLWARRASGQTAVVSAVIALNARVVAPMTGARSWRTLLLHEIGHATGLSHVVSSTQLMNAVVPARLTDFGVGDLTGLRRVGAAGGCLS